MSQFSVDRIWAAQALSLDGSLDAIFTETKAGRVGMTFEGAVQSASRQGSMVFLQGDMDSLHLSTVRGGTIDQNTVNFFSITGNGYSLGLLGVDLTYDSRGMILDGTLKEVTFGVTTFPGSAITLAFFLTSAAPFARWVATDATQEAFATLLADNDTVLASGEGDLIRGYDGNDQINGRGGADTLYGGAGNDTIYAGQMPFSPVGNPGPPGGTYPPGATYLRGDEGNDTIVGGQSFDDINGNMGNDTLAGGLGNDWVVGGKDDDQISGGEGEDLVYGNLGNDTLDGDLGADTVRGGQGDDSISGGKGEDFLSGDRGDDTLTGGEGRDTFHGSQDAGIDRVLDFSPREDVVRLDAGTTYTLRQSGIDTVIDMGGGNQMILVGQTLSDLTPGWIFVG